MGEKLVVGYCRTSTQKQDVSLARQEEQIRDYCKLKQLGDPLILSDELSGGDDDRPGFKALLAMCEKGEVGTVILYDLSRFSRSISAIGFMEKYVKGKNLTFVCLQQNLDTSSAAGVLATNFMILLNSHFLHELRWKTKAALDHKRQKGEKLGGRRPYGFSINDDGKTLRVNPAELEVLMLIRRLKDSGTSLRGICRELGRMGIPTATGLPNWSSKVLRDLLKRGPGTARLPTQKTDPDN